MLIQLTTHDTKRAEQGLRLDTSLISIYLNRCHLSFKQMMFENLAQLKDALSLFVQGKPYQYAFAPMLFEQWVEEKAQSIEDESVRMGHREQLDQIELITRDSKKDKTFHMKHLLTSIAHTFAKNDQQAVNDLHKYFDYNMRQKVTKQNTETGTIEFISWAVKVHYPALNLAGLRYRLGQFDASLLSVMESIKISQNKNDHDGILQCLVWLQQVSGALGNKDQEKRILEHVIHQANQ